MLYEENFLFFNEHLTGDVYAHFLINELTSKFQVLFMKLRICGIKSV